VPAIRKTAELVQGVTTTSREQAQGVAQVQGAMTQVDRVTQTNAAAAEELSSTAEEMAAQADNLQRVMSFFHLENSEEKLPATPPLRSRLANLAEKTLPPTPRPYTSGQKRDLTGPSRPPAGGQFSNKAKLGSDGRRNLNRGVS
jgi:methyl-accepting chemotaxis protein